MGRPFRGRGAAALPNRTPHLEARLSAPHRVRLTPRTRHRPSKHLRGRRRHPERLTRRAAPWVQPSASVLRGRPPRLRLDCSPTGLHARKKVSLHHRSRCSFACLHRASPRPCPPPPPLLQLARLLTPASYPLATPASQPLPLQGEGWRLVGRACHNQCPTLQRSRAPTHQRQGTPWPPAHSRQAPGEAWAEAPLPSGTLTKPWA